LFPEQLSVIVDNLEHSGVLLAAGGIGITPMRVLLAERLARQEPAMLLYFVRSLKEAPFLDEIIQVSSSIIAIQLPLITMQPSLWKYTGYIATSSREHNVGHHACS